MREDGTDGLEDRFGVAALGLGLVGFVIAAVVAVGLIAAWLLGNFAGWLWLVAQ